MTREEMKNEFAEFADNGFHAIHELQKQAEKKIKIALKEVGGSISWDYEEDCAPCIISVQFGNDLCDCYITRLFVSMEAGEPLCADLHAYYKCQDLEGTWLREEPNVDYLDLLSFVADKL